MPYRKGSGVKRVPFRPVNCTVFIICAVQRLSLALCGTMWSRDVPLLNPNISPPPHPSHFWLSLQAALQRDGLGWSRPRRPLTAKSVISRCWMMWVCIAVYFQYNYFLWSTPQMSCLLSIDCYYLFRLINHKSRMKTSAWVNHFSSAVWGIFQGLISWYICTCTCMYRLVHIRTA